MTNNVIKQIQGTAYWTKLFKEVPNFNKDGFEWTFDLAVSDDVAKELKALGLGPKIKDNKEYSPYITFKRATVKKAGPKAGEANKPVSVVGPDKAPWDTSIHIGNGSTLNVKFSVNEVTGGPAKKRFIRADVLAVQIWEYVAPPKKEQIEDFAVNSDAAPIKQAVGEW